MVNFSKNMYLLTSQVIDDSAQKSLGIVDLSVKSRLIQVLQCCGEGFLVP